MATWVLLLSVVMFSSNVAQAGIPRVSECPPGAQPALLQGLNASVYPQDVVPGENVTITVTGYLTANVTEAVIMLWVALDGFPVFKHSFDLCTCQHFVRCPVPEGPFAMELSKYVPQLPFSGSIGLEADVRDPVADRRVVCVDVELDI